MEQNISKMAIFTDIHWGAKANSDIHNQDCFEFITWFCDMVKKDTTINAIGFLGDWNENRNALNIATLNWSYRGAKMLNDLGLPIIFVVGNHDLYHRHTRELNSVIPFNEFSNFIVIEEPTIIKNKNNDDILFCPYMFEDEYPSLIQYTNVPVWMGHFEFKGYEVTGYGMKMQTGPDAADFAGPKFILSGHFHKRQASPDSNVVYVGNAFPTNFGDAGDVNRGMAIYDFTNDDLIFEDWKECPKYTKTVLSDLLDGTVALYPNSRVKCVVDIPVTFEESTFLRNKFTEDSNLREFTLEESLDLNQALADTEVDVDWDDEEFTGTDELVQKMIQGIESDKISSDTLVDIYVSLQPQNNNKKKVNG